MHFFLSFFSISYSRYKFYSTLFVCLFVCQLFLVDYRNEMIL